MNNPKHGSALGTAVGSGNASGSAAGAAKIIYKLVTKYCWILGHFTQLSKNVFLPELRQQW